MAETINLQPGNDGVYAPSSSTEQSTQNGFSEEDAQNEARYERQSGWRLHDGNEQYVTTTELSVIERNGKFRVQKEDTGYRPSDETDAALTSRKVFKPEFNTWEEAAKFADEWTAKHTPKFGTSEQTQDYKFMAKATDGREVEQALTASSPEMATLQSWDVIQQHHRHGDEIQSAKIEWTDTEGPQVSYIYNRAQGVEISRPGGIELAENLPGQQTQTPASAQVATVEHAQHPQGNRQHEEQQQQEHSIGFGY
jgi:hypothetical protein